MKPIAIGLSPNTQQNDVVVALQQIFSPWKYTEGKAISLLEQWFCDYFNVSSAVSFTSARAALYAILVSLGITKEDEILLQAFTCVVVPNAIVALGAKPVYLDTKQDYTIDPKDIEKKITKRTKAILVQHTFGISTDMDTIMTIAKKHNLFVIEDVAHSIGGEYKKKKLGTFGDASIFSLGRDKAFSSVFGGMAMTNNAALGKKIQDFQIQKPYPTTSWILQQLFHPIAFSLILPLYTKGIGKLILVALQKMHALSFPVSKKEKQGIFSGENIRKMPNALAILALHQLKKLTQYNTRRIEIAKQYEAICKELHINFISSSTPLLRFPISVENPAEMRIYFKKRAIYLGDWYAHVIDPKNSDMHAVSYQLGSCPHAEKLSQHVVNLPTYPTMSDDDVRKVCLVLKAYVRTQRNTI